jgi:hypothetical protein
VLLRRRIMFSHGTGGWFFSLQLPQSFETLVAACQRLYVPGMTRACSEMHTTQSG